MLGLLGWGSPCPAPSQVSASPAPQLPVSHHVPSNLCPMPTLRCSFIPKVTNYSSLLQPGRLSSLHHQHPSEISCGRGGRDRRALGFKLNGGQTLLALRRLKSQQMKARRGRAPALSMQHPEAHTVS